MVYCKINTAGFCTNNVSNYMVRLFYNRKYKWKTYAQKTIFLLVQTAYLKWAGSTILTFLGEQIDCFMFNSCLIQIQGYGVLYTIGSSLWSFFLSFFPSFIYHSVCLFASFSLLFCSFICLSVFDLDFLHFYVKDISNTLASKHEM